MSTKNNWFTTNLNSRSLANRCDFSVNISPYRFVNKSFEQASKDTAQELYAKYNNLYLAYSGGLDSEYVLKVFNNNGLKIVPVILRTPFNELESNYAIRYCNQNSIKYELVEFSKRDIIYKLYEKTCSQGLYSLLGGVPLILCDIVSNSGGRLLTGYGEPFTTIPGIQPEHPLAETLEFCEWDYYLDNYNIDHPSGFFTYDLSLFSALISEIQYGISTQLAKYTLYQLTPRPKMFWSKEFYNIFREIVTPFTFEHQCFISKTNLINKLTSYKE